MLVARRAEAEEDIALSLRAFVEKLMAYPGDAVFAVLERWPDHNEFWPLWKELRDELEPMTAWRRSLLADIERLLRWERTPQLEAPAAPQEASHSNDVAETDEERATFAAQMRARAKTLFPSQGAKGAVVLSMRERLEKHARTVDALRNAAEAEKDAG